MIIHSLLVGTGGFLGAIARFFLSSRLNQQLSGFPYGTFLVNILGAFLLGWIMGSPLSDLWVLLIGTGFMGAFTTFSTLKWESIQLKQKEEWMKLFIYLGGSYTAGILFAFVGYWIGKMM